MAYGYTQQANVSFFINGELNQILSFSNWGKGRVLREVETLVTGIGRGAQPGYIDIQANPDYAVGIINLSAGAGAVGGTIGGRLVTAVWATSDANSCDLIATAINADATANQFSYAVSRVPTGTITITGGAGVVTATVQTVLGPQSVSVTWATSDTATATALAALINTSIAGVIASSAAGVVTMYLVGNVVPAASVGTGATNTAGNTIPYSATGTGVTTGAALFAGGGTTANVLVRALMPGTVGLGITLVASGTGATVATGGNLVGGVGAPGNFFVG